ncbi:MAG: pyridoxal-phosphate dependent enzyme [bacterium]|nr:pyridoxal-phosphate dependent enzyme [bacterium]
MESKKEEMLEQAIRRLPRIPLGVRPTPLEAMPRLSEHLGGPPLYIKRDDLTGLAFGGNKTRMLEFSMADAKAKGAEVVVMGAAVQSNYCRQLAAACAKLGLELRLFMRPEREIDRTQVQGNGFLQRMFGAQVTVLEDNRFDKQRAAIEAEIGRLRAEGRNVYRPRELDTVDLDAIAYAEVGLELVRQCRVAGIRPKFLYTAALDTTQAGLVLGLSYLESSIQVKGISPFQGMPERKENMARMANQAVKRLGLDFGEMTPEDFDNDDGFVGERYGIPTEAGIEALHTVARCEGILLDPVYTSKAMGALFTQIREGKLPKDEPVVFLHTGGAPALFGYVEEVLLQEDGSGRS